MSKSQPKAPPSSKAPTGRHIPAQGKEPRDTALGPPPPQNPSPEGAAQMPLGWQLTDLASLLRNPLRNGHSAKETDDPNGVRSLSLTAVTIGNFSEQFTKITSADPQRVEDLWLEPGDLLIERSNTPELVGTTRLYTGPKRFSIYPDLVIRAQLVDPVVPRFVELLLQSRNLRHYFQGRAKGMAGSMPKIDQQTISEAPIPLPPLNEQKRIVSKIEELFSELDAGEESLRRARRQLGVYRQSLLKQAFEGKLTSPWRKQNPHLLESPDSPWSEVEVSDVLTSKPTNGRSVKDRTGGFKVLRLTALRSGKIDLREYKEGDWDASEAANHVVRKGDFLLSRGNGSIKLVGRGGVVLENADIAFPDTMIRLPLNLEAVDPSFFVYLWNSDQVRRQIEDSARTTAGIYKINQSLLTRYRLPLCPLPEQREIVRLLDEQFTVIEQNEREIDTALKRSAALRQSILKKAFTGQLVPQDPTDEPASALLERIRKERTSHAAPKKNARKPKVADDLSIG